MNRYNLLSSAYVLSVNLTSEPYTDNKNKEIYKGMKADATATTRAKRKPVGLIYHP
uniref:Transposase n=1 Tax=Heterorhabditis bacteriophora TaxID=37862 RepID=A0A1I7WSI9_HETBA